MAFHKSFTVVLNLIFTLSLIVVITNFITPSEGRQHEKLKVSQGNGNLGSGKANEEKTESNTKELGEMKDVPPFPNIPFPPFPNIPFPPFPQFSFPPPIQIPGIPPLPTIPMLPPAPPLPIPTIPFLTPPPA